MEIIKVGICLDDKSFAEAMSIGLARETSVMRFYLLNQIDEGDFCDLILSSEGSSRKNVVQVIREWEPSAEVSDHPPYQVYRYRESTALISDLLYIFYRLTGKVVEHRGGAGMQLLVFLSDSGGSGTTSTALSILKMLYRIYGVRSLYLNLCPLDDSGKYLSEGGEESLLRLLYYLDQDRDFPVESFISCYEELDRIDTGIINLYFSEMKPSLMLRFLHKVKNLGKYGFVAVDIGNFLSKENRDLLRNSETAVLISDGERKLPKPYRQRINSEIEQLLGNGRLIYVENFASDIPEETGQDDGDEERRQEDSMKTSSRYSVSKQNGSDLRLEKNYGLEISLIAREIMEGRADGTGEQE